MKKVLSVILVIAMCFSMMFALSACDSRRKNDDAENSEVNENVEPWKADAASEEMKKYTKFFRFTDTFDVLLEYSAKTPGYDPANPLTEEFHKYSVEIFDDRMDTLIKNFETEKESHPFAQKYLDELNKTNYSELSYTDKFIFECYAKLLLSDKVYFKGTLLETSFFNAGTTEANFINELIFASVVGTGDDIRISLWFPSDKQDSANKYEFFFADGGKSTGLDGMGNVVIPPLEDEETELNVESVKKIINDNISFFEFLTEYRDTVYAEIRNNEEMKKAKAVAPQIFNSWINKPDKIFTNKFGSSTTKCVVSGCSEYIASSGDTNCCEKHSNRCGNCNCYIDGDAMYCMSCIESVLKQ